MQVLAAISGNARVEDLVVGALDHMDRIDLDVAEMLDRSARRPRPVAERCALVEPLRAPPAAPRQGQADPRGHTLNACRGLPSGSARGAPDRGPCRTPPRASPGRCRAAA